MKIIEKTAGFISFFFLSIVLLLVVLYKNKIDWMYESAHISHNGVIIFGSVLLMLVLLFFCGKNIIRIPERLLLYAGILLNLCFGIYLIVSTVCIPIGDDSLCFSTALSLKLGDYSPLAPGGYLFRFPHQIGMIVYDYVFSFISEEYIFFHALNLFWTILGYYYLWKTMKTCFPDKEEIRKWTILLSFLFVPQILYILFIYGVTLGSCWLIIAIYNMFAYIKTGKIKNMIGCVLLTGLFSLVRQNLLIAVIAFVMILLFEAWNNKKFAFVIVAVCILIIAFLPKKLLLWEVGNVSGIEMSKGAPSSLCIAMGLQEATGEMSRPNGWFNGYNFHVYESTEYNYLESDIIAKKEISDRIRYMFDNPHYAYNFFLEKLVSSWSEPTFQCISVGPRTCTASQVRGAFLNNLYGNGSVYFAFITAMDIWLILVYLFSWLCYFKIIFIDRERIPTLLFFVILFLTGTFIFHFFWEIMSKYIYPVSCLIIIPAAYGIEYFTHIFGGKKNEINKKQAV